MIRDWSFIDLGGGEQIACGKYGVSKKGRDFINGLMDRIDELMKENEELRANKHPDEKLPTRDC